MIRVFHLVETQRRVQITSLGLHGTGKRVQEPEGTSRGEEDLGGLEVGVQLRYVFGTLQGVNRKTQTETKTIAMNFPGRYLRRWQKGSSGVERSTGWLTLDHKKRSSAEARLAASPSRSRHVIAPGPGKAKLKATVKSPPSCPTRREAFANDFDQSEGWDTTLLLHSSASSHPISRTMLSKIELAEESSRFCGYPAPNTLMRLAAGTVLLLHTPAVHEESCIIGRICDEVFTPRETRYIHPSTHGTGALSTEGDIFSRLTLEDFCPQHRVSRNRPHKNTQTKMVRAHIVQSESPMSDIEAILD
ncbi:hypothetical protein OE88DRAFT_1646419 [Heliocybe sulcata]|uniref:Uncharacterized protein n=1 Tax=Heliocybe sulcata TaxID=5364 RepID=A0A5C3MWZ4_9AGAM|nr:hypothetical protein OE88DRAFT_1646419 [Heliocybe sulcata]